MIVLFDPTNTFRLRGLLGLRPDPQRLSGSILTSMEGDLAKNGTRHLRRSRNLLVLMDSVVF